MSVSSLKSELRPLSFLILLAAGIINSIGVVLFLSPVHL